MEDLDLSRPVLVTGAFGLVGSWLVRALIDRGAQVVALRREGGRACPAVLADVESELTIVLGDLVDVTLMDRVLPEHDVGSVFHLASQAIVDTAGRSSAATYEVNIRGTWLLMGACARHGVERVVTASSAKVYGAGHPSPLREDACPRPDEPYAVSKAAADLVARAAALHQGVPVALVRCANVYGGGDLNLPRLVPDAIASVLAGHAPTVRSDGTPQRDFLHVDDAVQAYLDVAAALGPGGGARPGDVFNAGGGSPVAVLEVARTICRVAGLEAEPIVEGTPSGVDDRVWLDASRLRTLTGWRPTVGLEDGLRRTLAWYREHPEALGVAT